VMREARRSKARIIPVDSEHSAVFQCIGKYRKSGVRRIILTASGGPFWNRGKDGLKNISVSDALNHPKWKMGRKISIDSATLMNKGLEVIEACRLFGFPPEKVDVLIHPQSIVHSLVEFTDRSLLAQMSVPDMRGPISYALAYPERIADSIPGLELDVMGSLTFQQPDMGTFPCLSYAYEALKEGGTMPSVLNAANEEAVSAFLGNRILFTDIPVVIRKTMDEHRSERVSSLEHVLEADGWARGRAKKFIREIGK